MSVSSASISPSAASSNGFAAAPTQKTPPPPPAPSLAGAAARRWQICTPEHPAERAGTVSMDCPHSAEVCRELLARDVLVDWRPKAGIRLSPHFYNREEECDFALEQMDQILRTRAWEKHTAVVSHA